MEQGNEQGLEMSEKLTRRALNAAWGALRELSPCMAPDCKQVQTETLADAIKLVDEALGLASPVRPLGVLHQTPDGRVFRSFPATDAAQAPSEAVARDAARYRWLNKQHNFLIFIEAEPEMRRENVRLRCGEPLDAWLDKRIEAELPAAPSAGTPEERG